MGGVDLLFRDIVQYYIQQKGGNKWYREITELFIDLSCYNAFIVWKALHNSAITQHNYSFLQELVQEIVTVHHSPVGNYTFKVNNRNTRTRCEICSKLTIKTPEIRQ